MDHYRTLGLNPGASKAEIKAAFRRSALEFHPDRHAGSSQSARDRAVAKFKLVSEAYRVLVDDNKRAIYDRSRFTNSSSSLSYYNYYANSYGYGGGGGKEYYQSSPSPPRDGGVGFDFGNVFRYVTRRGFIVSLAFAGALFGSAVVIERSAETMWKINNPGKSFEDAIESIEKVKAQKKNS